MDDIVVRSRYPRRSIPARRRKRQVNIKSGLPALIVKQLAISVLILLVAVIIKSINTPVTNYITGKIQYVLQQNLELKNVYKSIDSVIEKIKDSSLLKDKDDDSLANEAVKPDTSVLSASTDENADMNYDMIVPVKGILTSAFEKRTDPITGVLKQHEGIDIEAAEGENVVAVLDGTVVAAGSSPSYGKFIKVRHTTELETVYAHCSFLKVVQGQAVKQGEVLGGVGDSGASVGVHLHFEVWKSGNPVNPLDYINLANQ